ncbi:MAG: hypothetical protein ABL936_11910 [Aestuariivirga sp.]
MERQLRAMALYNWPEDFRFSDHREFLAELMEDAKIDPTKLEIEIGEDKRKMMTVRKNKGHRQLLSDAPPFIGFEFCRPIDGNFLNLETDMSCSIASYGKQYSIANSPARLSVDDLLHHVALICKRITPQYGVSHVMAPPSSAIFFLAGSGTSSMGQKNSRRAAAIGYYFQDRHVGNFEYDRLIDVFEFNVLSPAHLKREVFGQSLASWIRNNKRGKLVEINSKVAVWLVPDDIRSLIRGIFFNAGLLEVEV